VKFSKAANFPLVLKGITELKPKVIIAGERGMRRGLEFTRQIVQRDFLRGPRPGKLDERTTRLRQSIAFDVKSDHRGVVGRIGSNVRYAAFHEFGFRGMQQVRAHTRAVDQRNAAGQSIDLRREFRDRQGGVVGFRDSRKAAASRQKGGTVGIQFVRAFSRRIDYAGRPFIRPALVKSTPIILAEIRKELAALKP